MQAAAAAHKFRETALASAFDLPAVEE